MAVRFGGSGAGQQRVTVLPDATAITPTSDNTDMCIQTNTQAGGTLTVNAPTGTPIDGQRLMLRLKCTNAQTLAFNGIYNGGTDLALPSATTGSSRFDYLGFFWNAVESKWNILSKIFGVT